MPQLKQRFTTDVKQRLLSVCATTEHTSPMIDALELKRRLVQAMDQAHPRVSSAALAEACKVSPQAVHGWRKTGLVDKKHLATIARLTKQPVDFFVGSGPFNAEASVGLQPDELEAIKCLRAAAPEWRAYVLALACVDKGAQSVLLQTMRTAVPDAAVEKALGPTPRVAARKQAGTR
jgi:hypothetical protein